MFCEYRQIYDDTGRQNVNTLTKPLTKIGRGIRKRGAQLLRVDGGGREVLP